jgi:phenylpropionate dioxygenase-like ring-hydroxylating dioxygenase large terminal subunit
MNDHVITLVCSDGTSTVSGVNLDALEDFWHPVGWSADVGDGPYRTVLLDTVLVVWRDGTGAMRAFRDLCLHRGTALSLGTIEDGCLVCPYHGWAYAADGRCVKIPQFAPDRPIPDRVRMTDYHCEERYGLVWVCLGEPKSPIPDFPEWDDDRYRHVPCAAYTWETSAPRMVENFTDFGHLGYLHDGLLGTRDNLVVPSHHVDRDGYELHYELTMQVPNTNDRWAVTSLDGERGLQRNLYVLSLPHTIWLQCTYLDTGRHRTLYFVAQPNTATSSTGYCFQSRDFDLDGADEPYAEFQEFLAEQDRIVIESQRPEELPLDVTAELHLSFDRVAISYRRALADIGIESLPGAAVDTDAAPDDETPDRDVASPAGVAG